MSDQHSVIIFGGTGHSGKYILKRAVAEGHQVTAFVRTPSKVPEKIKKNIQIVQGDVLNSEQVGNAIKDHDVVLSALGKGLSLGPTTLMSEGAKNIVSGMKKHEVKNLVMICGAGSLPNQTSPWLFRHIGEDHKRVVEILKQENESLRWVTLHPPLIRGSGIISPNYQIEKDNTGKLYVNAGEIADFMMKYISDEETVKKYQNCLLGISAGPSSVCSII
uniref:flavin reductase (NADPH)-like isoform X1 n=1 Tax=Styela clava TaxID=7725 RepID=UPI0019395B85|nr:flavin reductase (NADPH)-like isoform X1 [Styela clava]